LLLDFAIASRKDWSISELTFFIRPQQIYFEIFSQYDKQFPHQAHPGSIGASYEKFFGNMAAVQPKKKLIWGRYALIKEKLGILDNLTGT